MPEKFANNARTTLDGSIDDNDTTLVVVGFSTFPSSAEYRIKIDNELMLVTGGAGTDTWTVTRGIEGTTARSHADGAVVKHVLTAGGIEQFVDDRVGYGNYTGRPAAGVAGRVYHANNINMSWIDDGSNWNLLYPLRLPSTWALDLTDTGTWTAWNNTQISSTSLFHESSMIRVVRSAGAHNNCGYSIPLPAAPFTFTVALEGWQNVITWVYPLIGFRNSGTAASKLFMLLNNDYMSIDTFSSNSAYTAQMRRVNHRGPRPIFLRIRDDNTDWIYSYSYDGFNYMEFYDEPRNTGITPDTLVVGGSNWSSDADDLPAFMFYGYEIS